MIGKLLVGLGVCAAAAGPGLAQEISAGAWTVRDLHALTCCSHVVKDRQWIVSEGPSRPLLGGELRSSWAHLGPAEDVESNAMAVALRYPVGRGYLQGGFGAATASGDAMTMQPVGDHMYVGQQRLFQRDVAVGYRLSGNWGFEAAYVRRSWSQRLQNLDYMGSNSIGVRLAFRMHM